MQTLIIILIVVLIAQTCVVIYANFFDLSRARQYASVQEMMTNTQSSFLAEKSRLQECIDNRDKELVAVSHIKIDFSSATQGRE